MKRKLLLIIPAFNHGGTNKSLLNLLGNLNPEEYQTDVLAMAHYGPYKRILADYSILKRNLLLSSIFEKYSDIKTDILSERFKKTVVKMAFRLAKVIAGKRALEWVYKKTGMNLGHKNYDLVIAMQEGYATHFAAYIPLPKIAWIRCDYRKYFELMKRDELNIYQQFNAIICVSEYTKQVFTQLYPTLEEKCYGIHNIIDHVHIKQMADNPHGDERFITSRFTIISVGRLSNVKQFHLIPQIASDLKIAGCDFKWYIIGEGEERPSIEDRIEKHRVSDVVILLGEMDNPYPYIKYSNLLVCTSLSEACPNVINEAKILHIPVVSTNFGSAGEFIDSGRTGLICGIEEMASTIEDLIKNKKRYEEILHNISNYIYPNSSLIGEVTRLFGITARQDTFQSRKERSDDV